MGCDRTIEYNTGIITAYHKCDKKPFINVTFQDVRNKPTTQCLCKTHYNAFVKNSDRINKKTGFDFKIKTELI